MVRTHRHRLERPEEGFIQWVVRLVPRMETTLTPRAGTAQERRLGQHLRPGEQRQSAEVATAGEHLEDADKVRGRCTQAIDGVRGVAVPIGDAERKDVAFAGQWSDLFPLQQAGRDGVGLRETHDVARQVFDHPGTQRLRCAARATLGSAPRPDQRAEARRRGLSTSAMPKCAFQPNRVSLSSATMTPSGGLLAHAVDSRTRTRSRSMAEWATCCVPLRVTVKPRNLRSPQSPRCFAHALAVAVTPRIQRRHRSRTAPDQRCLRCTGG